ncbi:MAG: 5-(carboxyamino)imidazole ribonucleotide synthase [Bacteroidales bacterium]|jgi:5-(carboxyamino)imidazole ribonucleotide synthase|nr:5-(carboxyamino)imidazole ribonucleotide synthase [Bacteroidales bacterium]
MQLNPDYFFNRNLKLGILGGGQLGKMLLLKASQWNLYTRVLTQDREFPLQLACTELLSGDLMDFDTVYDFGKACDVLTIEIEHVNTEALEVLEQEGVIVHPRSSALKIVNDKGLQKQFFVEKGLPTAPFKLYKSKDEIIQDFENGLLHLPFVQKSRKGGYDGRGVFVVNTPEDLKNLIESPSVVEKKIQIVREISVIAARNSQGQVEVYDPVGMEFNPEANLLDLLVFPEVLSARQLEQTRSFAIELISGLDICGLLAVEMFVDENEQVWINEIAPRPHNSGHQTIESCITSQYEQHLRGILGLPLGPVEVKVPSVMVNLLGWPGYSGKVNYENLGLVMKQPGVHVHIYGKNETRPFRKMGHVTVTHPNPEEARKIAIWVKNTLKVTSL